MAAALLLTAAAVAVAVVIRARARALAESYRRAASMAPGGRVVVVPGRSIEAYALPGSPGRIVVSGRLLDALDDRGRAALLAHEHAHLAGRHHLFTTVAHLAAAANPLLLPVARAVDYTVERWADERAAAITGDRRLVASTIGQVALLATAPPPARARRRSLSPVPVAAGPRADRRRGAARIRPVSLAWAGPVPRRVAALLAPPPRRQLALLAIVAILILTAGASAAEAPATCTPCSSSPRPPAKDAGKKTPYPAARDEPAQGLGGLGVLLGVADQGAGQGGGPFADRHRLPGQHHAAHRAADLGHRLAVAHRQRHLQLAEPGHDLGDLAGAAAHPVGHGPVPLHRHAVGGQRLAQGLGQHAGVDGHVRAVGAQRGGDHVQRERVVVLSHRSVPRLEILVLPA